MRAAAEVTGDREKWRRIVQTHRQQTGRTRNKKKTRPPISGAPPHFTHSPVGAILSSRVFIGDRLSCYIAVLVAASTIGTRTLRIRLLGLLLAWVETIHIRPTELI